MNFIWFMDLLYNCFDDWYLCRNVLMNILQIVDKKYLVEYNREIGNIYFY